MQPHALITWKLVFRLAVLLSLPISAPAAVTNVGWYRLGENDPGAASGVIVTSSATDLMGLRNLTPFGSPRYTNRFAPAAASQVGSSLSVNFNGTSQYLSNAVVSTAVDNFGLELWAKPNATDSGNRTIVYNGNPLVSGWGLIQRAGTEFRASLGTMTAFGSGVAAAGVWTHLALVRDNGTTTFYVNGVASGTSLSNPIPPAVSFTVAAHPDLIANTYFNGAVDEVRIFTFGPGQFSTNLLLLNVQRITTLPATSLYLTNATLAGSVNAVGFPTSAWFEWGTNTGYGQSTTVQTVIEGTTTFNFSRQLTGLAMGEYHFRAVCSNKLGVAFGSDRMFALTNVASGPAGGGQPVALGQPALELNFIICTNGNYGVFGDSIQPPFYGEVRLFAGNFAPARWAFCHGQQLYVSNNLALFSVIHTAFGGDGANTFTLPDTRSRAMVTAGQGPGFSSIIVGQRAGATQTTLGDYAVPVHTHPLPSPYGNNSGSAGSGGPRMNRMPYIGLSSLLYTLGNFPSAAQTTFEPFMGEIALFAGTFGFNNAPRAEGQVFAISQNTALYAVIRTNFGGDGSVLFALPDLRGRAAMSIGQGAGLTARSLGEQTGVENVSMTVGEMPSHQHTMPTVPPIIRLTGSAGSNQPQTLMQPSLALRFLICTNGQVPSPSVQATNKMLGQIQPYAGTNVPGGWTMCDGQMLSVSAYPSLFGVISNFFGGNGVTTFALPDLRGRIPVGSPTGQPGAAYGSEQFVMTEAQLPTHIHPVPVLDFPSWSAALGLAGADAEFDADADGDGAKNGLEWATGTELTNAGSFAPLTIAAVSEQAKLRFSRNTNATDVTIHLQRTAALDDPNAWSGLVTNALGIWSAPGQVSETGTNSVRSVEVSDALTNSPAADYRLKITRP